MFDKDRFIEDCRRAVADGQGAGGRWSRKAVSDPAALLVGVGEPQRAGIVPIYRTPELTIIHFAWAPCMGLIPHNQGLTASTLVVAGYGPWPPVTLRHDDTRKAGPVSGLILLC